MDILYMSEPVQLSGLTLAAIFLYIQWENFIVSKCGCTLSTSKLLSRCVKNFDESFSFTAFKCTAVCG